MRTVPFLSILLLLGVRQPAILLRFVFFAKKLRILFYLYIFVVDLTYKC